MSCEFYFFLAMFHGFSSHNVIHFWFNVRECTFNIKKMKREKEDDSGVSTRVHHKPIWIRIARKSNWEELIIVDKRGLMFGGNGFSIMSCSLFRLFCFFFSFLKSSRALQTIPTLRTQTTRVMWPSFLVY